jgi:glycerol-3-phosphate acyltransferase PlsY
MSEPFYLYILCFISGYLFGSVPWAFILGKINGIDIRKHGSGNVGATNVRRTLGKKWGILCFFLDFMKGFLPILVLDVLYSKDLIDKSSFGFSVVIIAAASVVGHMWPLFLKFKGGKGVSTIAGILLAVSPLSLLAGGIAWGVVFYSTRYVSLASIAGALTLPISAFTLSYYNIGKEIPLPSLIMLTSLALLAVIRHKGNIVRLLNGTENRFVKKNSTADKQE